MMIKVSIIIMYIHVGAECVIVMKWLELTILDIDYFRRIGHVYLRCVRDFEEFFSGSNILTFIS